jgi:uncharacterized membrane protein HdeD (DUF308 family)
MSTATNTASPASDPQTYSMNALLAENWWAIALRGVCAIVFGVIALAVPVAAMLSLAIVFSAYLFVDGIFGIVSAVRAARAHERWGLLVVEGIVNIVAGAIAFLWPGITVLAFVLLVAARAIVSGALMLAAAFRLHVDHGRVWLVIGGIASVIFGALLLMAPIIGALVLTWWLGAYAIIFGVLLMILSFKLRSHRNDHGAQLTQQPA